MHKAREVIQNGLDSGEDLFPGNAVQPSIIADDVSARIPIVESTDKANVQSVATALAEFIGVPVDSRSADA